MSAWNPRANEIFLQAAELSTPADRQAYLNQACGENVELRAEAESLLQASAALGDFLEQPAADITAAFGSSVAAQAGSIIGPYRLLEQIGEGGFGVVFMAEQMQPVRRRVALKIIKPGMDTRQVIARFEAERQALALMEHPHIARVLDAGATDAGRPYFVMELVKGIPITTFCDQRRLNTRERLALLLDVCHAVQHAHQKGIIHRDRQSICGHGSVHVGSHRSHHSLETRRRALRQRKEGTRRFEAYGEDAAGPWRGFQVWRPDLDALLLQRACDLGVHVLRPCTAQQALLKQGCVCGVRTSSGSMTAAVVVDASGRSAWSRSALGVDRRRFSPHLVARYGYAEGSCSAIDSVPFLAGDSAGWLWTALIRPGLYQWTRVVLDGQEPPRNWRPDTFRDLSPLGPPRGADVTWRLARTIARPGWFAVGDAAAVLDPTSANGVLRALLSGMIAGKLACAVVRGQVSADEAARIYADWLTDWFNTAAGQLSQFYQALGVSGFGVAAG